jgi:hypothetical protein
LTELPIAAHIREIDNGAFYPVKLATVPRVGDLIDLYSFIEAAEGQPPNRRYEVVQVVHKVRDVTNLVKESEGGMHFVTVHVRPAHSPLFSD